MDNSRVYDENINEMDEVSDAQEGVKMAKPTVAPDLKFSRVVHNAHEVKRSYCGSNKGLMNSLKLDMISRRNDSPL